MQAMSETRAHPAAPRVLAPPDREPRSSECKQQHIVDPEIMAARLWVNAWINT